MSDINITTCSWQDMEDTLRDIRNQVFIQEQGVPQELEWDDKDADALHFIASIDGQPVACARLIDNEYIGRMAVLAPYRNLGLGHQLIESIKHHSKEQEFKKLTLSAQCHAFEFYKKSGFSAHSTPYNDAQIPHVDMSLNLLNCNDTECNTIERSGKQIESEQQFVIGKDKTLYRAEGFLEGKGYLDMLLSQCSRSISISLKDLHHPICSDPYLIERIKKLARTRRFFNVHILLNFYHPSYNEHPLFRLQSRLPSFVDIRLTDESIPCQWIFDGKARLDYEQKKSRTCFSDQAQIKHFMERYNKWWHNAQLIQGARRLFI